MNDDTRRDTDSDEPESSQKPSDSIDSESGGRREPVFTDFDDDENYEEADRDTDYASAYEAEAEDDEYLEPLEDEDPDDISAEWQVLGATSAAGTRKAGGNPWDVAETRAPTEKGVEAGFDEYDTEADDYESELKDADLEHDPQEYDAEPEPELLEDEAAFAEKSDQEWNDEDDYPARLEASEQEGAHSWPLGLVIVGIVALVLLAAGGYGVIQQRSATQEEIRQLQATLATAASPADVAAGREALREMEQRNENLVATVDRLNLENRRLSDTVSGLEKKLSEQSQPAAPKPAAAKPKPAPKPAAQTKPEPASTAAGGDWFVNFSSYSQRSVAESWAKKLKPSAGKAVVATSSKDGKTFYRVRIVGLADRSAAQKVASQLESSYKLPPLWVGSE
jgi:cell division septation protein DedD